MGSLKVEEMRASVFASRCLRLEAWAVGSAG